MKRIVVVVLAATALALAGAGVARANEQPLSVACTDGTVWTLEPFDVDEFAAFLCDGAYVVVNLQEDDPAAVDDSGDGVEVGLGADPNMDPDPSLYRTEVRCPDGVIWAVPFGEPFVCP